MKEPLKPIGANYLADLIGINLEHVLETYLWEDIRPMTDDGITVSGFVDERALTGSSLEGFRKNERGVYVQLQPATTPVDHPAILARWPPIADR